MINLNLLATLLFSTFCLAQPTSQTYQVRKGCVCPFGYETIDTEAECAVAVANVLPNIQYEGNKGWGSAPFGCNRMNNEFTFFRHSTSLPGWCHGGVYVICRPISVGNAPISSTQVESETAIQFVSEYTISESGTLKSWEFFAFNAETIALQVWRPSTNLDLVYDLVASVEVEALLGHNEVDADLPVQAGDVLGWYSNGVQPIVFSEGGDIVRQIDGHSGLDHVDMSADPSGVARTYSIWAHLIFDLPTSDISYIQKKGCQCPSGSNVIDTEEECEIAAAIVSPLVIYLGQKGWGSAPFGCIRIGNSQTFFRASMSPPQWCNGQARVICREETEMPTFAPSTSTPSEMPTLFPTTEDPSNMPTEDPTEMPTSFPTTEDPSQIPTFFPTTEDPTEMPTSFPTTEDPTEMPTLFPTTEEPSIMPTDQPTFQPSAFPTTEDPTSYPTTEEPTVFPTTEEPTKIPTYTPTTSRPTEIPSLYPTTEEPSKMPTFYPTTEEPTNLPSLSPTPFPSNTCIKYVCDDDFAAYEETVNLLEVQNQNQMTKIIELENLLQHVMQRLEAVETAKDNGRRALNVQSPLVDRLIN